MKKICILLAVVFFVILWAYPAVSEMKSSVDNKTYASLIDTLICKCENKAALSNSQSENIRREVSLALMKASFYRKNKELFIEELKDEGVEPKLYKVQYFLNHRFFLVVRDHDPKAAQAYSEPDDVNLRPSQ